MAHSASTAYSELRRLNLLPLVWWGMAGSLFISLASWGAGAGYAVDSWLAPLHLDWLCYGHGQLLCQFLFWGGVLLLIGNWARLGRHLLTHHYEDNTRTVSALVLLSLIWMVPFLIANPILSRDVFSYLAQGSIQRSGASAYDVGPNVLNSPGHITPLYLDVSGDWRNTTTPYGPLHLGLMELIVFITQDHIHAGVFLVKLLCMLCMVGIIWASQDIAKSLKTSSLWALWCAGANPLMLLHLIGGMHNEALMVALMAIGLALVLRRKHVLGIAVITLGAAIKATAFIALPFVIWIWLAHIRQDGKTLQKATPQEQEDDSTVENTSESYGKIVGYFIATACGGAVLSIAIFAVLSLATGTGLGFIEALEGSGKVINWLTIPTVLAHFIHAMGANIDGPSFASALVGARHICSLIMGILIIPIWIHYRKTPLAALRGLALSFLVLCLFNSLAFPWYYSWILVFVGALALNRTSLRIIAALCSWNCFTVLPNGVIALYNYFWVIAAIVIGVIVYRYLGKEETTSSADLERHCLRTPHNFTS
ncbi:polyprenol phosphomannose-dependent alpha 1,6 mannosyltransferase MptB [Lawsonella clevelandensis]|uniref:Alpha-(1->6)-mannopyranosyltransferase A n=1 Tax=Lawsonella clevelandensis TaxID=1528099 RepID=A0A2W5IEF0_9ACTN|nr:polyprenol phosphomannose-dependent alpha 1,6 mannosyltransferase MptB [Lawsonella clevelandensis]PZP89483.1 MAG: hypothetical protein DI579_02975 [Lawsonella clevelandensis]